MSKQEVRQSRSERLREEWEAAKRATDWRMLRPDLFPNYKPDWDLFYAEKRAEREFYTTAAGIHYLVEQGHVEYATLMAMRYKGYRGRNNGTSPQPEETELNSLNPADSD